MHRKRTQLRTEPLERRLPLTGAISAGWDTNQLTYEIDHASIPDEVDALGNFSQLVADAFAAWQEPVELEIREKTAGDPQAHITITFVGEDDEWICFGKPARAIFSPQYYVETGVVEEDCSGSVIDTTEHAGRVMLSSADIWEIGASDDAKYDLKLVVTHEIGHALGIRHIYKDKVMAHQHSTSAEFTRLGLGAIVELQEEYTPRQNYHFSKDLDGDGTTTQDEINAVSEEIDQVFENDRLELIGATFQERVLARRDALIQDILGTNYGDANLDGVFDSADFISIFQAATYNGPSAGWASGDWNGDGRFDSGDLVAAFEIGAYESDGLPLEAILDLFEVQFPGQDSDPSQAV